MGRFIGLHISIYISQISIYTLSDLGVLSNLICSLSRATLLFIQNISPILIG